LIRHLIVLALIALALSACTSRPDFKPAVNVDGPKFAASQFDCGPKPLPPSAAIASSSKAGSAGAHHENDLGQWGQSCANKLASTGDQLRDAGQVVDAKAGK
jgi:hypothetical protein